MSNMINWFEIPTADFERAIGFYREVLQIEMPTQEMMGIKMAFFPMEQENPGVSGALVYGEEYKPSQHGALVYFNGGNDLNEPLSRVENAGGKVMVPKTLITEEIGYFAIFLDSEGNKVAFHSFK